MIGDLALCGLCLVGFLWCFAHFAEDVHGVRIFGRRRRR